MKIFVDNLSLVLTEDDLERIFASYGKVDSVNIVTDKLSGLPCGFIEMPNEAEAALAMRSLEGSVVIGQTITLRVRDENSERRAEDERRFVKRRESMERRMPLDRRLYIDKIEFDNRREISHRRLNPQRRSSNNRRSTASRRELQNRRM